MASKPPLKPRPGAGAVRPTIALRARVGMSAGSPGQWHRALDHDTALLPHRSPRRSAPTRALQKMRPDACGRRRIEAAASSRGRPCLAPWPGAPGKFSSRFGLQETVRLSKYTDRQYDDAGLDVRPDLEAWSGLLDPC